MRAPITRAQFLRGRFALPKASRAIGRSFPVGQSVPAEGAPGRALRPHVSDGCLDTRGIVCRVCEEKCEAGAVRFRLAAGGAAYPIFDLMTCTGCADCAQACPVRCIEMREAAP